MSLTIQAQTRALTIAYDYLVTFHTNENMLSNARHLLPQAS